MCRATQSSTARHLGSIARNTMNTPISVEHCIILSKTQTLSNQDYYTAHSNLSDHLPFIYDGSRWHSMRAALKRVLRFLGF